jgi:SAM-dependent methyltransferase
MDNNFNLYSDYYDLLYSDKNYKAEVDYVLSNYHSNTGIKILELGCGSGGHAEFFCENGNIVYGLDLSASMVEKALEKKINNFQPYQGNIIDFNLDEKFDLVTSMFHVISYLNKNTDLLSCFKSVNNHLQLDGLFIFDYWYAPAVLSQKPESRIKIFESNDLKVERVANSELLTERNLVNVNFDIKVVSKKLKEEQEFNEWHSMRYFTIPEIELFAAQTGFELLKTEELITKNDPSENTWAVCSILKKIK